VANGIGQVPHDTASAFGIGATLGVQVKPVKGVALGVAYETKSFFGDFSFDVPAHQVQNPNPPPATVTLSGKDKLEFNQPSSLSFGVSGQAAEWLLLAVDAQWIRWSETNGKDQPKFQNDTNQTGSLAWNLSWKDQWVVKVGAQIDASRDLKLRVGWNYGKTPLDKTRAFENIAFPAIAEHHVTAGLGYAVSDKLAVNVGGMYAPQVTLTGANLNQGLASYETKMSQWQADLGIAYRF
jgi:long-chain fatty acid transport protein